jgi:hypothetical protein
MTGHRETGCSLQQVAAYGDVGDPEPRPSAQPAVSAATDVPQDSPTCILYGLVPGAGLGNSGEGRHDSGLFLAERNEPHRPASSAHDRDGHLGGVGRRDQALVRVIKLGADWLKCDRDHNAPRWTMNKTNELALQTRPLPLESAPADSTEAARAVLLCYHDGRFICQTIFTQPLARQSTGLEA